ncbi:hypothetical protein T484DRAFT_1754536, partial [Baffinella frigidus]
MADCKWRNSAVAHRPLASLRVSSLSTGNSMIASGVKSSAPVGRVPEQVEDALPADPCDRVLRHRRVRSRTSHPLSTPIRATLPHSPEKNRDPTAEGFGLYKGASRPLALLGPRAGGRRREARQPDSCPSSLCGPAPLGGVTSSQVDHRDGTRLGPGEHLSYELVLPAPNRTSFEFEDPASEVASSSV